MKGLQNGYLHICISSKETLSCKRSRPDTSPNLSWQAGVARGSFREFEMWVRVGKDEVSLRTIVNFFIDY